MISNAIALGIALGVADAAFHLALGTGTIREAGPGSETPARRERQQPIVEGGLVIVPSCGGHQCHRVVHQHRRARHPAEMPEGAIHAVQPGTLRLRLECRHKATARIPQRRYEQVDLLYPSTYLHPTRAEVDLHLIPGFVSNRGVATRDVRNDTSIPNSRRSSWCTTSALPA